MILAIDTSCDETSVAITEGLRNLAHINFSQVKIHKAWGGVVPSIAKKAHQERIDWVIANTIKKISSQTIDEFIRDKIDKIAVTQGPGLAIALEVGINKAKELAQQYNKPIVGINHIEGHIYSCFVQNSHGNPDRQFNFPFLAVVVSGGHTEIALMQDHGKYKLISQTRDDAVGEALDKSARLLGLGYPGAPVLERLASEVDNCDFYKFPRPMRRVDQVDMSFSGLKTAFLYKVRDMSQEEQLQNLAKLASSIQEAVFATLLHKIELALNSTGVKQIVLGGGVTANQRLRNLVYKLAKKHKIKALFPPYKYLTGDNAVMIAVVAHFKQSCPIKDLDRIPRLNLFDN